MSDFDFLDQYNTKQLGEMIPAIQKLIKQKEKAEKNDIKQQMAALAAESGFTIDEILGGGKAPTKRVVKPKYQNPDNGQTWSGRGRKPKWVLEITDNGGDIEDYAI